MFTAEINSGEIVASGKWYEVLADMLPADQETTSLRIDGQNPVKVLQVVPAPGLTTVFVVTEE